jgi:hypothetical protein
VLRTVVSSIAICCFGFNAWSADVASSATFQKCTDAPAQNAAPTPQTVSGVVAGRKTRLVPAAGGDIEIAVHCPPANAPVGLTIAFPAVAPGPGGNGVRDVHGAAVSAVTDVVPGGAESPASSAEVASTASAASAESAGAANAVAAASKARDLAPRPAAYSSWVESASLVREIAAGCAGILGAAGLWILIWTLKQSPPDTGELMFRRHWGGFGGASTGWVVSQTLMRVAVGLVLAVIAAALMLAALQVDLPRPAGDVGSENAHAAQPHRS